MPQFTLTTPRKPHPFYDLDDFAKGYVEAMFFTNGDTGDNDESLLNDLGVIRLTRESVATIKRDCDEFQRVNADDLALGYALSPGDEGFHYARDELTPERAGNLFWYARQGHGIGWDDDGSADCLKCLQAASRLAGEAFVEVSRSWIYVR